MSGETLNYMLSPIPIEWSLLSINYCTWFSTIVVRDDSEAVTISECSEVEHSSVQQHLIEFVSDLTALDTGSGDES